jgi:hypothetical protein
MSKLRPPVARPDSPEAGQVVMLPGAAMSGFEKALRAQDAEAALSFARQVPWLSLDRELRLTLLLSDQVHPLYEPSARRFLVRFIQEPEPRLFYCKRLAYALAHVQHGFYGEAARQGLDDLIWKLRGREQRLLVEFDSVGEDA